MQTSKLIGTGPTGQHSNMTRFRVYSPFLRPSTGFSQILPARRKPGWYLLNQAPANVARCLRSLFDNRIWCYSSAICACQVATTSGIGGSA